MVLSVGEEHGEVQRDLGVRMVVSGLLRGVGVGEAKAVTLRGLRRGRASSGGPLRRNLGEKILSNGCALPREVI